MPKLFEPPFSALNRSGFSFALALVNLPEARTIYVLKISGLKYRAALYQKLASKFSTLSHTNPYLGEKKEIPPRRSHESRTANEEFSLTYLQVLSLLLQRRQPDLLM